MNKSDTVTVFSNIFHVCPPWNLRFYVHGCSTFGYFPLYLIVVSSSGKLDWIARNCHSADRNGPVGTSKRPRNQTDQGEHFQSSSFPIRLGGWLVPWLLSQCCSGSAWKKPIGTVPPADARTKPVTVAIEKVGAMAGATAFSRDHLGSPGITVSQGS